MPLNPSEMDIPVPLLKKLTLVRQRKLLVGICVAGLVALAVLMAAMSGAMFIDWTFTLFEPSWRMILLLGALCAAGATLLFCIVWTIRRSQKLTTIAGDVDRELPELEERWSTVTDISGSRSG